MKKSFVDRIIVSPRPPLRLVAGLLNSVARIHPKPVLILGNQKSGTTAIAILLAYATNLPVTIDLGKMREHQKPGRRAADVSITDFIQQNKLEFSRAIIKEPSLTFFAEQLIQYYPQSKFIFIIRDPRENIRSILDIMNVSGNLPFLTQADRQQATSSWLPFLNGTWLEIEGDHYIDMLAARWNLAADIYTRYANHMVLVRYEDFMQDKVGTITHLAQHIEHPLVRDITDKTDMRYNNQYRGQNRGKPWEEFFGVDNLARIQKLCSSRMHQFGYETKPEL